MLGLDLEENSDVNSSAQATEPAELSLKHGLAWLTAQVSDLQSRGPWLGLWPYTAKR